MLGQPISMLIPQGGRVPADRRAAGRHDRHRPGADDHRAAAQARRGRQVRRVPRRRRGRRAGGQPGHDRQHEPGVRLHLRDLPDRRGDPDLPAADRPAGASRSRWSRPTPRSRACGTSPARRPATPSSSTLDLGTVVPSLAGPKRPQDRVALTDAKNAFREALGSYVSAAQPGQRAGRHVPGVRPGGVRAGLPAVLARPGHAGRRHRDDDRPRRGGDRGDHLLHEHVQPVGDGRRGAAGQEGGRGRAGPQAVGEDHAGARLQGGHGLLRARRAHPVPGEARLQPGRLRLHHLHRQLGPAARGGQRRGRRERPGRGLGAVRQPELRGPDQPGREDELPGLAAAGGRLRAGRDHGHRPDHRAARHRRRREAGLPGRHLAVRRPRSTEIVHGAVAAGDVHPRLRGRVRRRRPLAGARRARPATRSPGTATPPTCGGRRTSTACRPSPSRSPTSTAPGCWPCSATRSPPTTSRRPGRSRPTARPGST